MATQKEYLTSVDACEAASSHIRAERTISWRAQVSIQFPHPSGQYILEVAKVEGMRVFRWYILGSPTLEE